MSDNPEPLKNAGSYMKHCTKCPHMTRDSYGNPLCGMIEGGGHGQLHTLVKEGMPCPDGRFGDASASSDKPKAEPRQDEPHFIFSILSACQSATFHFDDGDLKWTKK